MGYLIYRVIASREERIATYYSQNTPPTAADYAIYAYCFQKIVRARRIIAAGGNKPHREILLIKSYQASQTSSGLAEKE
jgi:hypothetical protein